MADFRIGSGICLAYGGTNARTAECKEGEISGFKTTETPTEPDEFFRDMATQILDAAEEHFNWVVAGFPGPVKDGEIGPFSNIDGMRHQSYNLREALLRADSTMEEVFSSNKFRLFVVNDGELAAQAVAAQFDREAKHEKISAFIVGTGVGTGVVQRDNARGLPRNVDLPLEIGHIPTGKFPGDTPEKRISGPALERQTGLKPQDIPWDHKVWEYFGRELGECALTLGAIVEVDLIVPTGGVGMGASDKYREHLQKYLDYVSDASRTDNPTQQRYLPEVKYINPDDYQGGQTFEMYGAEGVVRDHSSRTPQGLATRQ